MEHLDFSGISWDLSSGNLLHNYGKWPYKVDFNGIVQWKINWIFMGFPLENSWDLMGNQWDFHRIGWEYNGYTDNMNMI